MLVTIKDCTARFIEVGSIEATYIAHHMINAIRAVGEKTVYLVVIDGGADWVAAEQRHGETKVSLGPLFILCGTRSFINS